MNEKFNQSQNLPGQWDLLIQPQSSLFEFPIRDIWRYRDLLYMFIVRDVVTVYKQTVLGPIWFFIQPILTMLVYVVVFGRIAGISTDGIPQPLFYVTGIIFWNYFSQCFSLTSNIFRANAGIFGKVYFPRLVVPLSIIVSNLIKFLIQGILFMVLYIYYSFWLNVSFDAHWEMIWIIPVLIIIMAFLGLSFGMIFSAMTTKYRDLNFLVGFGVQLLMYATPIIYPMSVLEGRYRAIIWYNPMTHIIESIKYVFLGVGEFSWAGMGYALAITLILFFSGLIIFNKTEKTFMDTV